MVDICGPPADLVSNPAWIIHWQQAGRWDNPSPEQPPVRVGYNHYKCLGCSSADGDLPTRWAWESDPPVEYTLSGGGGGSIFTTSGTEQKTQLYLVGRIPNQFVVNCILQQDAVG